MPYNFWAAVALGLGAITVLGSASPVPSQGNQHSVLDYGAVCDGTTDDRAALTRAAASGRIYVPAEKTCYSSGPIAVSSTNRLEIAGGSNLSSWLVFGGVNGGISWTGANAQGGGAGYPSLGQAVAVHGIGIATKARGGGVALALTCTSQPWVRIYNTVFQGWSGGSAGWNTAISAQGCSHIFAEDNYLWGPNGGKTIKGSVGIQVENRPGSSAYVFNIYRNEIQGWETGVQFLAVHPGGVEGVHVDDNHIIAGVPIVFRQADAGYKPPGYWASNNDLQCDGIANSPSPACIEVANIALLHLSGNLALINNYDMGFIDLAGVVSAQVVANYVGTIGMHGQPKMTGIKLVAKGGSGQDVIIGNIMNGMRVGIDLGGVGGVSAQANTGGAVPITGGTLTRGP